MSEYICVFCSATIFIEAQCDVASCFGCLERHGLSQSGAGLVEYLRENYKKDVNP